MIDLLPSPLVAPVLGAVAAILIVLALRGVEMSRTRRDRRRLADHALLRKLVSPPGRTASGIRTFLLVGGSAALAAALAGSGARPPEREEEDDRETVFVLDASNSMLVTDVADSRLALERRLATGLAARVGGRQGVVYFAGRGYVLSPLTKDASAILMYIEAVDPSVVGRGGSAVVSGLRQALSVLEGGAQSARKAIVLFSDGESTVDEPTEALLTRASRLGVPIHTVGIGTARGGPVPYQGDDLELAPRPSGREPAPLHRRDAEGRIVVSHLEEVSLREIAAATGGLYVPGDRIGIERLAQLVAGDESEPVSGAGTGTNLLLLLAFALLWAEAFVWRRG